MIELVEVPYLKMHMNRGVERRPWEVNPENVEQVRQVFPKWMKERHGIVVYECPNFDSSALGDKAFMPRMFDSVEKGMQPAQEVRQPTGNCSDQQLAKDWIWIGEGASGAGVNSLLDACFYYEVGRSFGPERGATIKELRIFARENGIKIRGSRKSIILDCIEDWIEGKPVTRHHLMSGKILEARGPSTEAKEDS